MMTILYICYNNLEGVQRQILNWSKYPPALRDQLRFILVDDCSDEPLNPAVNYPIHLKIARITQRIEWNIPGAKNLGMRLAETDWVFVSDIKHILAPQMAERLVNLEKDPGCVYFFQRIFDNGKPAPVHTASFLVHKETFWKLGGFDEDFSGHYGWDDIFLLSRMQKHYRIVQLDSVFLVTWESSRTKDLNRDGDFNEKMMAQKMREETAGAYRNGPVLRFKWEIGKNLPL
jgi:hypothetical protein